MMRGHLAPARPRSTVLGYFLSLAARPRGDCAAALYRFDQRRITIAPCLKLEFWRRAPKTDGRILVLCWTR